MLHNVLVLCVILRTCTASVKLPGAASTDLCSACLQAGKGSQLGGLCFGDHAFGSLGSLQLLQTKSEIRREGQNPNRNHPIHGIALSPAEHVVELKNEANENFTAIDLSVATDPSAKDFPSVKDIAKKTLRQVQNSAAKGIGDIVKRTLQQVEQRSAANATGVTANEVRDSDILFAALVFSTLMSIVLLGIFILMKSILPFKYDCNIRSGVVDRVMPPIQKPEGHFGWFLASLALTTEQVQDCVGLDNAMLLEFTNLGMKVCLGISLPVVIIMSPLNYFLGGGRPETHGLLGRLTVANVADNSRLYWVYALLVWGIVVWIVYCLNEAQASFLTRRQKWLKDLPLVRATTLLVENIPKDYRSDAKLKEYFDWMFPSTVHSAYVVRQTSHLLDLIEMRKQAIEATERAEAQEAKDGHAPDTTSIEDCQKAQKDIEDLIRTERSRFFADKIAVGSDVYSDKGFVRFKTQRALLIAQNVQYISNDIYWQVSVAPPAEDIRWRDLQLSYGYEKFKNVMGYTCLLLVFIGFTPAVILCTNIAEVMYVGPWRALWISAVPTLGLVMFMGFLPTCFAVIFRTFFSLKADSWAQRSLQDWYWWFMLIFIVMVTAIGSTIIHFATQISESPYSFFPTLAYTLPQYTRFYWCFFIVQWIAHALVMTRYMNVFQYFFYKNILQKEDAHNMSEPEDQNYHGIGSRSARFSIYLVIAIVFCTISPLMCLFGALGFWMCRIAYGFLLVFAEVPKPDLGGAFWVQQLHHCFVALYIYVSLMLGVLFTRCGWGPCLVVLPCLVYIFWSWQQFSITYKWESLPFQEVVLEEEKTARPGRYPAVPEEEKFKVGTTKADMLMTPQEARYEQPELFHDR